VSSGGGDTSWEKIEFKPVGNANPEEQHVDDFVLFNQKHPLIEQDIHMLG
jgi:hypothetical protein